MKRPRKERHTRMTDTDPRHPPRSPQASSAFVIFTTADIVRQGFEHRQQQPRQPQQPPPAAVDRKQAFESGSLFQAVAWIDPARACRLSTW